jgi:hypothetical protein
MQLATSLANTRLSVCALSSRRRSGGIAPAFTILGVSFTPRLYYSRRTPSPTYARDWMGSKSSLDTTERRINSILAAILVRILLVVQSVTQSRE